MSISTQADLHTYGDFRLSSPCQCLDCGRLSHELANLTVLPPHKPKPKSARFLAEE